ncbi:MAG: cell-division associated ABC transporter ATP binding FtsE subunit [Candidatus Woesebacteria bacterium GW2011_GWF1_40_24]|uniref:Cell-division associated ABC transporter ATP binding FtsE subunit n=1 Tax=Candidatus Woesebacteria bacterium GW2011_GWF1_40_24 TaxID=1618601 RepID=A0A0G0RT67_9BACT|nr:MAG: cell-division associated ABC transporter ATP binding FtsE subunit [Candidatus Woesebacteria bacterium GW2011_GWF1_40_24]
MGLALFVFTCYSELLKPMSQEEPVLINFKSVTKSYGSIVALSDMSFDVKKGEFVANLNDKNLPSYRQRIGVIFQDFKVLSDRTVYENVAVALAVIGLPEPQWEERVKHILRLVGLSRQANFFPSQLSGGELQRVSLARALSINPKIILADEPTGNLDWKTADGLMDLLEKINKEGKTIIMATHNMEIVDKYKKRVIHVDGKKEQVDIGKEPNNKKDNTDETKDIKEGEESHPEGGKIKEK